MNQGFAIKHFFIKMINLGQKYYISKHGNKTPDLATSVESIGQDIDSWACDMSLVATRGSARQEHKNYQSIRLGSGPEGQRMCGPNSRKAKRGDPRDIV